MRSSQRGIVFVFAAAVFMAGLCQGFSLALKKPLWNDEIYSQTSSVEGMSWAQIWTGRIREGNNSPAFYSVQKIVCGIFGYKSNDLWKNDDVPARLILRIAPVVCMSLGLALIVWFFGAYYALSGMMIAFIVGVSSYMVWYYWAEARPYAMMFLATTVQALLILYHCRFGRNTHGWGIGVANLFLAFVSSLSVIQIAASGFVVWMKGGRRIWPLLGVVGLPLAVAFGYYKAADHYAFWFAAHGQPLALIGANISAGRLAAFFILPVLLWAWDRYVDGEKSFSGWPFFMWAWLTFFGYVLFLSYLMVLQDPAKGFEISNRYLMTLTPLGIVGVCAGILELARRPKALWLKAVVWIGALGFVLPRLIKVWHWMGY